MTSTTTPTPPLPTPWDLRMACSPNLTIPRIRAPRCGAPYTEHFNAPCTRAEGHTGRHASTYITGLVLAVWGGDDQ